MKRDRNISKNELHSLCKELRAIARECGFTIKIKKYPVKLNNFYCDTYGHCNNYTKQLVVNIVGRPANRAILFTMAHEVRHALHIKHGLYKSYYTEPDDINYVKAYEGLCMVKLNLGVAVRAERDCNSWADKWLISKNIKPYKELYSFYSTQHAAILRRKKYFQMKKELGE